MNFIIILLFWGGKNGSFSLFIHINIVKTIFQSLTEQQCFIYFWYFYYTF